MLKVFLEHEVTNEVSAKPTNDAALENEIPHEGFVKPINDTWSYKFFKTGQIVLDNGKVEKLRNAPAISQHDDIIDRYLAKYPVIYIDLSRLSVIQPVISDFNDFFKAFQKLIGEIYRKHDYLIQNVKKKVPKAVQNILEEKEAKLRKFKKSLLGDGNNPDDVMNSIALLSEFMYKSFGRRVVVLVNDYDALIKTPYFEMPSRINDFEAQKIVDFFATFMSKTLEMNPNLEKGIISGVFNLATFFTHSTLNYITNYNLLNKNMQPFYGFTKIEVDQLYTYLNIPEDKIKTANEWYRGYETGDSPRTVIYNPWSILNFANTRRIEKYWSKCGVFNIFPHIFQHKDVRHAFESIISTSADATLHRTQLTLTRKDIESLRSMINNIEPLQINDHSVNLILIYYYAMGYITVNSDSTITDYTTQVPVKIPNKEIESEIISELKNIYRNILGNIPANAAQHAANSLIQYVEADGTIDFHQSELKRDLILVNSHCIDTSRIAQNSTYFVGDNLRSAHFLMLLYAKLNHNYNIAFNPLYYEDGNRKMRPYIVLYKEERGVVVDFNFYYTFSGWFARLTGLMGTKLKTTNEFTSYFDDNPSIKSVQVLVFFVTLNTKDLYFTGNIIKTMMK